MAVLGALCIFSLPFCAAYSGNLSADFIRGRWTVPGLNWLAGSIGALVPLGAIAVLAAAFADQRHLCVVSLLLAGIVGALVDIPLSVSRNRKESRSELWMLLEVGVLAIVAASLSYKYVEERRREEASPQVWGFSSADRVGRFEPSRTDATAPSLEPRGGGSQ